MVALTGERVPSRMLTLPGERPVPLPTLPGERPVPLPTLPGERPLPLPTLPGEAARKVATARRGPAAVGLGPIARVVLRLS